MPGGPTRLRRDLRRPGRQSSALRRVRRAMHRDANVHRRQLRVRGARALVQRSVHGRPGGSAALRRLRQLVRSRRGVRRRVLRADLPAGHVPVWGSLRGSFDRSDGVRRLLDGLLRSRGVLRRAVRLPRGRGSRQVRRPVRGSPERPRALRRLRQRLRRGHVLQARHMHRMPRWVLLLPFPLGKPTTDLPRPGQRCIAAGRLREGERSRSRTGAAHSGPRLPVQSLLGRAAGLCRRLPVHGDLAVRGAKRLHRSVLGDDGDLPAVEHLRRLLQVLRPIDGLHADGDASGGSAALHDGQRVWDLT